MGNVIRKSKRSSAPVGKSRSWRLSDGVKKHAFKSHDAAQPQHQRPTTTPQVDLEVEAVNRIRGTLRNDLETFVLNNLLMSVQFFENFEREMLAICSGDRDHELQSRNWHCIMPDRVLEAVSQHVQLRPQHGARKHHAETLAAQRLFVVHDNIELCTDLDNMHYTSVDGPNYYFATEPSRREGYMKLRCDESIVPKKQSTTYDATNDGDDLIYDEPIYSSNIGTSNSSIQTEYGSRSDHGMSEEIQHNPHIIHVPDRELQSLENINEGERNERLKSPPLERKVVSKRKLHAKSMSLPDVTEDNTKRRSDGSSGYKSGGSLKSQSMLKLNTVGEYSYTTIKNLTTPRKLATCTLGRIPATSAEIPNECFQRVTTKAMDTEYHKKELFEVQYFLNSDMFMCNFVDVFSHHLAEKLGFNEESVEEATKVGAKIMCDKFHGEDGILLEDHYEVIPTLKCNEWPTHAKEWLRRTRESKIEGNTTYVWPTQRMLQRVKAMGYHLLPIGYMLKKEDTLGRQREWQLRQIEWQLAFPEAERYLETCLTHAQIRCYLFVMTMYKSFLEPVDAQLGLLPSHIRTLLFWQCEKHFTLWPEDQPGETMKKFIDIVYNALQEKKLSDYFVRKHNLLESTPDEYLHIAQEKIYRIKEHLVTHMLQAIRNLRFKASETGGSFYPLLDYKKLYQIITWDNLVALNNPNLRRTVSANPTSIEKQASPYTKESLPLDMWRGVKTANPQQKFAEKAYKQLEQKNAARRHTVLKGSTESIDVKVQIKKGADPLRRKMLLELFIPHFIEMAKASNRHKAGKQADVYLQQAERLTTLLGEESTEAESAHAFSKTIRNVRQASQGGTTANPTLQEDRIRNFLPKRNSNQQPQTLYIRTQIPLPGDTVQHPEINRPPLEVTLAQVHSSHVNAAKVAPYTEPRPAIQLPSVREKEYDEILTDPEETSL